MSRWLVSIIALVITLAACGGDAKDGGKKNASGKSGDATSRPSGDTGKSSTPPSTEEPALASIQKFIDSSGIDVSSAGWRNRVPQPPMASFTPGKSYFWHLDTNKGPIKLKFMPDVAPMHVTSTIYLTKLGFYDGLLFHRVIPNFMAQGGCPNGNGRGSPGYKYAGEFSPSVRHDRPGLLSMANAGPNTDGSQFFITFVPTMMLNNKHTIFGEVVEGMDTVKALEAQGTGGGQTREKLSIDKATISVE